MEQQNREYNDEINLYDFWKVIVKRRRRIIGLFLIIVISTAIVSLFMPDIYRGEAVFLVLINPEVITAKEIIDLIGNVDREKQLSIVPKSYPNVKCIKFKAIRDSKDKLVVTIDAKKMDDIPRALSAVVDYLNNIYIIKSTVSREKAILLRRSAELSDLIKSAPDLLATAHKLFKAGKLSTMGFNPIEINKKIGEIKVELLTIEQHLSRLNNGGIEIVAQLYISNDRVSPKILLNVVVAGIISFLLGVLFAFFKESREKIKPVNNGNLQ